MKIFEGMPLIQSIMDFDEYNLDEIEFNNKIKKLALGLIKEVNTDNNTSNKNAYFKVKCSNCDEDLIKSKRYKCTKCFKVYLCETCMNKNKDNIQHEFKLIEEGKYDIEPFCSEILKLTKIKNIYKNDLKGIYFFYIPEEDNNNELYILKFFNLLLEDINSENVKKVISNIFRIPEDEVPKSFFKKIPYAFNLLFCNNQCSEEKINIFFKLAVNCPTNNLFIIINPEKLEIEMEKILLNTFQNLLKPKNCKIESCIIFFYSNPNSYIFKQLKKVKNDFGFLEKEPSFFKNMKSEKYDYLKDLDIEIVTSDYPCVGKTSYIIEKISSENIYIPLGETSANIIKLLLEVLSIFPIKPNFYLQIFPYYNKKKREINANFLFSFLILKYYHTFNIFKDNIKIFIEIPSEYKEDYLKDYTFLEIFRIKNIEFRDDFYENIKIQPQNLYSDIVSNYLYLLDSKNINKSRYDKKRQKNTENFHNLIVKYFIKDSIKKPNLTQVDIFVSQFGNLLYSFESCEKLSPHNILKSGIKKLESIREIIINYYIQIIKKLVTQSYESILETQKIAFENQKMKNNSDQDKKKTSEELNKRKNIISYENIKPPLVLFNYKKENEKGNDSFTYSSIISTNINNKEDEEIFSILNQKYLQDDTYRDIKTYEQSSFIRELRCICLTPNSYFEKFSNEINKQYKFTADNFIKMVLIYLRIRANIPIILLGETGCGKTELLNTLHKFIQHKYNLLTLNVHSDCSIGDFYKFFLDHNLIEERFEKKMLDFILGFKIPEKKTIVFLDEINTTNALQFLTDLFTKHSLLGRKFNPNVRIIAACNPYRLLLNNKIEIGYNKERHKIRNLVYTVNPLPFSLINYIFDFGNLKGEYEKQYIQLFLNSILFEKQFSLPFFNNYSIILYHIINAVFESQDFIRKNSEISSVSLREIKRFEIFFIFFLDKFTKRKDFENIQKINFKGQYYSLKEWNKKISDVEIIIDYETNEKKKLKNDDISTEQIKENYLYLKAANLSIFTCYYIRIVDQKERDKLNEILSNEFSFDFIEMPLK